MRAFISSIRPVSSLPRRAAPLSASALALICATGCTHLKPIPFPSPELLSEPIFKEQNATPTPGGTARIATYGLLTEKLGRCTSDLGELTAGTCSAPGTSVPAIDTDYLKVKFGPSRIFSRTLSVDFNANVSASVVGAKTAVSIRRMQFILESAAFQQQNLQLRDPIQYVTAVDVGFALRVVFDVSLKNSDTNASANFGFGSISTALATGSASVTVRFDSIGISANVLPTSSAANISSVDSYLAVLDEFYQKVAALRNLHTSCVMDPNNSALRNKCDAAFSPGIVAYHVANYALFTRKNQQRLDLLVYSLGYRKGTAALASGRACESALKALSPRLAPLKQEDFALGFKAAFAEFAPGNRCDNTPPDQVIQQAAVMAQREAN